MRALAPQHADSLATAPAPAAEGHGEAFNFAHLLDHVKDAHEIELPWIGHVELPHIPPVTVAGVTIDLSPTKHVVFLLLAAIVLAVWAVTAARSYRKNIVPRGMTNVLEAMVLFIRDEVALPNMGPAGLRYVPYLLTTFFFILVMNLLGLIPYGATSTGNIAVTAGLAVIAFIMIQVAAIRAQGLAQYLAHLTGGVHPVLWPIMVPIEVLGLFTKPFALCIRLFANMTGGHIVILSLLGLVFLFRSFAVGVGSVLFSVGISLLELLVAFIQAYVFTMLTSLFMGLGIEAGHASEHQETGEHAL